MLFLLLQGISLLLVEAGMPGFEKGKKLKKMGLKAQDTSELFFDNVKVRRCQGGCGGDCSQMRAALCRDTCVDHVIPTRC